MYKTKNTGTGNGVRESGECYILGTDAKHSVKYRQAFWKMSPNIPRNSSENSGKSKFRFISWNLYFVKSLLPIYFVKSCLFFYQVLLLNCYKTMKKQRRSSFFEENIFSTNTNNQSSQLNLLFFWIAFSFPFPFLFLCWGKRVITVRRGRGIKKL